MPAVYDIVLAFKPDDPVEPTMTNLLHGKKVNAHIYMKRIPMEDVPKTEEEQDVFLKEMFKRKDKLKESFVKTGDFFKTSGIERIEPFTVKRRVYSLINIFVWAVSILCPMIYYLISLFLSGELVYFSIGAGIIAICKLKLFNLVFISYCLFNTYY